MKRSSYRLLLLACLSLTVALPAYGKAPLEKIIISGSKLAHPVEVKDPELLKLSNPWFGKFADWSSPPQAAPSGPSVYNLTLYAHLDELKAIYQFRYAPNPTGGPGQVYLPGEGEEWYRQNSSIILRDKQEGRWHPALPDWESRIKKVLETQKK